ncbi:MAG TPA: NAD(P)/FAD-dependent oxidoreductase [Streptosporangiaceae bacterium]
MPKPYDAVIVGTRVAGAATAMLLARRGLRVLAVDRARFPSDTLSTHQIQLPGVACLRRWGLLDEVVAAGTPATRRLRFDAGDVVLNGRYPVYEDVDALYSPRRTILDQILVEAARAAGAEIRESFIVDELCWADGRVTGIRGFERGRPPVTEPARLVIGADGKHSFVARAVGARRYRGHDPRTVACYTYWSGLSGEAGEIYRRAGRAAAVFPTNDDLTMIYASMPVADFAKARGDLAGHYLKILDGCGDLGDRCRDAARVERLRTTPDLPNALRTPYGPGWALVGDAGQVLDPITAYGITNAFRDAERLADAVTRDGPRSAALARYHRDRDAAGTAMYDFTIDLAALARPGAAERQLYAALADRPAEISRFFGVLTGAIPIIGYFTARNMIRLLGPRRLARLARLGLAGARPQCARV